MDMEFIIHPALFASKKDACVVHWMLTFANYVKLQKWELVVIVLIVLLLIVWNAQILHKIVHFVPIFMAFSLIPIIVDHAKMQIVSYVLPIISHAQLVDKKLVLVFQMGNVFHVLIRNVPHADLILQHVPAV